MQLACRFRLPALLCALAVLVCALVSHPYAEMGIADDGPYVLMAQHLARTGRIAYNGWAAPMLGWQLYLGAACINLFSFSFTAVRMSTLLVAMVTAGLLERTLVLAGINERSATLGTLAFVLSPLYLMLSVTYMSDIFGLLAVVTCTYGCLRALQASTDRTRIFWLCFAVGANGFFGTARQIAWLGVLVMVPSALYLLRERRRVLLAGAAVTLAGTLFIFACMQWLKHQPYSIPENLALHRWGGLRALSQFSHAILELPFLTLPIIVLFIPELLRDVRRSLKAVVVASTIYSLAGLLLLWGHAHVPTLLEPYLGDWVTKSDGYGSSLLGGEAPVLLSISSRTALTFASIGGLLGLIASVLPTRDGPPGHCNYQPIQWRQLCILLGPCAVAYTLLLIPRAASRDGIFDRYLLELLVIVLPCILWYYLEWVQPRLPSASILVISVTAIYSVVVVHNMFSFYRARVALAAEIRAADVPDTRVDNGWEYNFAVELRHSDHLNDPDIESPRDAYVPTPPLPAGTCNAFSNRMTPHLRPIYGVSFDPNACYGPAPFAPVHYTRWLASSPGTLYVVRYLPPVKP